MSVHSLFCENIGSLDLLVTGITGSCQKCDLGPENEHFLTHSHVSSIVNIFQVIYVILKSLNRDKFIQRKTLFT